MIKSASLDNYVIFPYSPIRPPISTNFKWLTIDLCNSKIHMNSPFHILDALGK